MSLIETRGLTLRHDGQVAAQRGHAASKHVELKALDVQMRKAERFSTPLICEQRVEPPHHK